MDVCGCGNGGRRRGRLWWAVCGRGSDRDRSRIGRIEHGESRILLEGLYGNQSVLSGSLRGLQNLKDQRRRVVWYLALVHAGLRRRRGVRLYAAPP